MTPRRIETSVSNGRMCDHRATVAVLPPISSLPTIRAAVLVILFLCLAGADAPKPDTTKPKQILPPPGAFSHTEKMPPVRKSDDPKLPTHEHRTSGQLAFPGAEG